MEERVCAFDKFNFFSIHPAVTQLRMSALTCSHTTFEPMEDAILVLRAKHPSWGARKLKASLGML
jgi:hypothetical protein